MKAWPESPWTTSHGRIGAPDSPAPLHVKTGLDDDRRRALDRGHPLYGAALLALLWQDGWSNQYHGDFWTWLVDWPRERGQRQLRETLGWGYHILRREGMDHEAIADALGYPPDTLRRYRAADFGEMVWHEQIERPSDLAAAKGPLAPLPRVYTAEHAEPEFTWVNLPLAAQARPSEVLAVERRAHAKLAELRGPP